MIFNKTIFLSITFALLSHVNLHGMENLKDIMPYKATSSDTIGIGVDKSIHSLPTQKITLEKEKKIELANKKLENKEAALNITTAIAAAAVSAPIIFYAAGQTLPIIHSGIEAITQTGDDVYHFLKDSLPNRN